MKTFRRVLGYLRVGAQVTLTIVDVLFGLLPEPGGAKASSVAPNAGDAEGDGEPRALVTDDDDDFKPERIQFWLEVIGKTCLAVAAVLREETGKPRGSDSDAAEKVEE